MGSNRAFEEPFEDTCIYSAVNILNNVELESYSMCIWPTYVFFLCFFVSRDKEKGICFTKVEHAEIARLRFNLLATLL